MNELLITYGPDRIIERFGSRYEAEAAWQAVVKHYEDRGDAEGRVLATRFGVRSIEDPRWANAPEAGSEEHEVRRIARTAAAKAVRRELGATATLFVKQAKQGEPLSRVISRVERSMAERGLKIERWAAQDAVKARVLIGRAYYGFYSSKGEGYWLPKSEGPLADVRLPNGAQLAQSTLSLKSGFRRI